MTETFALLENEYCPPIDPALLSAILLDFDLSNAEHIETARETLDAIKTSALEEEASGFDPSGSAHLGDVEDHTHSEHGAGGSGSTVDTDCTSLSNGVHSLDVSDDAGSERDGTFSRNTRESGAEFNKLDADTKLVSLQEMFPDVNSYTIKHILQKCNDDSERAMEELLNHSFFNEHDDHVDGEAKISRRSVDAFMEDNTTHHDSRRKKKDKRKGRSLDLDRTADEAAYPSPSRASSPWEITAHDVAFLTSRVSVSTATVTSMYNANGRSIQKAITALLDSTSLNAGSRVSASDPAVQSQAAELGREFPSIHHEHTVALVRLTWPSETAAHEVAKALTARPTSSSRKGGIEIVTHYAPLDLSDSDTPSSRSRANGAVPHANASLPQLNALTGSAFEQASAAYRRGRSDHLMGAAAAYYSQVGRDYAALRVEASAEAADALVTAQSPKSLQQIDLHGVTVRDAVRIAQDRTNRWWRVTKGNRVTGLDGRVRGDAGDGFRIVTGLGRHSEGGRGKLGPAVARALMNDGWRVEIGTGAVVVIGKSRH